MSRVPLFGQVYRIAVPQQFAKLPAPQQQAVIRNGYNEAMQAEGKPQLPADVKDSIFYNGMRNEVYVVHDQTPKEQDHAFVQKLFATFDKTLVGSRVTMPERAKIREGRVEEQLVNYLTCIAQPLLKAEKTRRGFKFVPATGDTDKLRRAKDRTDQADMKTAAWQLFNGMEDGLSLSLKYTRIKKERTQQLKQALNAVIQEHFAQRTSLPSYEEKVIQAGYGEDPLGSDAKSEEVWSLMY